MSETYIHGTSPEEQDRLSAMNDLINDACLVAIGLSDERRVLDVGSGLGQFTRLMRERLAEGARVLGVEADDRQLAEASRLAGRVDGLEFRPGRAESLPLGDDERGTFDLAHARFLLEHHRQPRRVVEEMVRAVRPGGRIVLLDDDHDVLRCHPEPVRAMALWRAYLRSYERLGCDPYVGRRLPALLHAAGARPRRALPVTYGACAGQPQFRGLVLNLSRVMESARDLMLEQELATADDFTAMAEELAAWAERPDAALWYSICLAEGVRE